MQCPYCESNYTIKKGRVKRKRRSFQCYKCNNCGAFFTEKRMQGKSYDPKIIVQAITTYNKGFTLQETSKKTNKKFHVKIYPQLISTWLKEFKQITPYQRIRREKGPHKTKEIKKHFEHKQVYEFKCHRLKTERYANKYFFGLRSFLESIPKKCPNKLFQAGNTRSSQIKIKAVPRIREKFNQACELAGLALKAVTDNKKRHSTVQEFMLYNDTSTLAIEVPVWLYSKEFHSFTLFKEIKKPITGHIDLVQIRYGLIHVLDYKPDAETVSPIPQLFTYALALSKRTGIWLRNFKCAWFNERVYKEFSPASIVLENERIPASERKQYVLNEEKQLFHEKRMLKERFEQKVKQGKPASLSTSFSPHQTAQQNSHTK